MKATVQILVFIIFFVTQAHTQEWLGYSTSNYAGINAVQYNPALITQTNYGKLDISIIATNVHVENNYLYVNSLAITDPVTVFSDPDFQHRYIRQNVNGLPKSAIVHANVQSPAFLLQITKRDAIGFCARPRVFVNADNFDEPLAQLIYEGLNFPPNLNQTYLNNWMSVSANAWMEYDFSYARNWFENDHYKLKGGITFKLLQGLYAGGLGIRNYQYNFYNDTTLALFNANVQWGLNDHLYNQEFVFDFNAPGFAFDIGFTFEYTPSKNTLHGLYSGGNNKKAKFPGIFAPDETRYKYKFGFSANDLGAIFYQRAPQTRDFFVNVDSIPLSVFSGINSISSLNTTLQGVVVMNGTDANMTMSMPAHINLFGDVRFRHNFGLHTGFTMAFNNGRATAFKNHFLYQLTVTPRWEIKWFGVYLPIWVSQYFSAPNLGISLRLGPLVIGTGDILGHLIKREFSSIDVHMALRLILPYIEHKVNRKHDRGGTGSSCENFKPDKKKKK